MKSKSLAGRTLAIVLCLLLTLSLFTVMPVSAEQQSEDYKAIAYVTVPASENWRWIGTDGPEADDAVSGLDVRYVTHINFAFGMLKAYQYDPNKYGRPLRSETDDDLASPEAYKDPSDGQYHYKVTLEGWIEEMNSLVDGREYLRALVDLKKQKPELKVLLSVGGWDSDGFCYMAQTAEGRAEFIQSCIDIVNEYNLDGIDLDWEYPTNGGWGAIASCGSCVSHANTLLCEMREAFDAAWDDHKLLTIASGCSQIWVSAATFNTALDYMNVMCYDYSPGSGGAQADLTTAASYMSTYASTYGDKTKLNLGIPFYNEGGASLVPYFKNINWSGYVDCSPEITVEKMEWVKANGYGGGFYWNYSMDLFEDDIERLSLDSSQEKILQKSVYVTLNGEPEEPVNASEQEYDIYWTRSEAKALSGSKSYADIASSLPVKYADTALSSQSNVSALYASSAKTSNVTYGEGYAFDGGYGGYEDSSTEYVLVGSEPKSGAVTLEKPITITAFSGNVKGWYEGTYINKSYSEGGSTTITITQSGRYIYVCSTKLWWLNNSNTYSCTSGTYVFLIDVTADGTVTAHDGSLRFSSTAPAAITDTNYAVLTMNNDQSYTLSYSDSQAGNAGTTLGGFTTQAQISLDTAFGGTLHKVLRSSASQYAGTAASVEYTYVTSTGSTPVSWSVTGDKDAIIFDSATGKITANGNGTAVITATAASGSASSVTVKSAVSTYDGIYLTPDSTYSRYTDVKGVDTEKGRWASVEGGAVTAFSGYFYIPASDYAENDFYLATKQGDTLFGADGDYYIYVNGSPLAHISSQSGAMQASGFNGTISVTKHTSGCANYARYASLNGMYADIASLKQAFTSLLTAGANRIDIFAYSSQDTLMVKPYLFATAATGTKETVTAIAVTPTAAELEIGETVQLTAAVTPANAANGTVSWSSSNESVATVSASGVVTAVAAGEAVITASAGGYSATCTVTVNAAEQPEPTVPDAYVFKVGDKNAYWTTYSYAFTCDVPCRFVDSVTYVPFRIIATAAGASDITYADGNVQITNKTGYVYNLTIASKDCTLTYEGTEYPGTLNSAPQFIDGVCCLPVRDVSNITGASVAFVSQNGAGYVIVSESELSSDETATVIAAYEAAF